MERTISVKDFYEGRSYGRVYIDTHAGRQEVTGIRNLSDGPWVVCGRGNAGFGLSYCVTWDTRLTAVCQEVLN